MDVISGNVANADVTRQEDGTPIPYRRRFITFATGDGSGGPGVHVEEIRPDPSPFKMRYEPGHVDADPAGYLHLPNVDVTLEYVDMMAASRAYEVNAAMLSISRNMVQQAIRLFA
jgi:flagellar basal-body rod protein FlgC